MKSFQTLFCCLAAVLVVTEVVEVKGGSTATTDVTSRLVVPADSLAPVFFSDQGQSNSDTYVTTAGRAPVSSIFLAGGDWQLDTTSGSRAVWLDLGDPSLPFPAQYVHALLTTQCARTGSTPVASLTGIGSSTDCGMSFRIDNGPSNAVFYRIHFNSVLHPGTGDVRFVCNAVASGGCIDWAAFPADNDGAPGDGRSTGQLVQVTSSKGKEIETLLGWYPVNFRIHITYP
jgi:hypothetical protein